MTVSRCACLKQTTAHNTIPKLHIQLWILKYVIIPIFFFMPGENFLQQPFILLEEFSTNRKIHESQKKTFLKVFHFSDKKIHTNVFFIIGGVFRRSCSKSWRKVACPVYRANVWFGTLNIRSDSWYAKYQ